MNAYASPPIDGVVEVRSTSSALSKRALLASLRCRAWTARVKDKAVTGETADRYRAEESAVSVSKKLIECDELNAVMSVISAAGKTHVRLTLPWADGPKGAPRILAVQAYSEYVNAMREHQEALDEAVRVFAAVYPEARDAAKRRMLGKMFDESDYPDDITDRFSIETSLMPVPDKADWRVDLGDDDVAILRADLEQQTRASMNAAVRDAYERVAAVVSNMALRLREFEPQKGEDGDRRRGRRKGCFKDSLVSNVADIAALLPLLNVTQDPALDALAKRMTADLTRVDPDELRNYEHLRTEVAGNAEALLRDISSFLA